LKRFSAPSDAGFHPGWFSPDFHQFRFLPLAALILATFSAIALSPSAASPRRIVRPCYLIICSLAIRPAHTNLCDLRSPLFAKDLAHWISAQTNSPVTLRSATATGPRLFSLGFTPFADIRDCAKDQRLQFEARLRI
jgi:hypothetical protein